MAYSVKETVANNIRRYRKKANLTMEELADKLGTTKSNVSSWENMKHIPSIATLVRLCDIFGVTINQLYGIEDTQKDPSQLVQDFFEKLEVDENRLNELSDEQINIISGVIKNFLDNKNDK